MNDKRRAQAASMECHLHHNLGPGFSGCDREGGVVLKHDDFIRSKLPIEELMVGLAEEAAELAQAALKYRRAATGINPTPVSVEAAWKGFLEEVADVNLYLDLLLPADSGSILTLYKTQREKMKRWVQRLKEVEG